jgi:hypothetical protein
VSRAPRIHSAAVRTATLLALLLSAAAALPAHAGEDLDPTAGEGSDPIAEEESDPAAEEESDPAAEEESDPAAVGPARAEPETDPPQTRPRFDPWAGIDRDGRIPAAEIPPDLPNPQRWRYIPEGRLKPGNVLQRFGISSFVAPFLFHSEDIGWGGGLAIVDIDFRAQRRREFAGIFGSYSEEGQQSYSILWRRWLHHIELPKGGVLQEERSFLTGFAGYSNTLTRRFYGFGADTSDYDETRYSDERVAVWGTLQRAWPEPGDDLVLSAGLRGEFHNLGSGVGAPPETSVQFPLLFAEAEDRNLGFLEAGVSWDTRDSQMNAYGGWQLAANVRAGLLQTDWRVGALFGLSARRVFAVPGIFHSGGDADEANPPTDTIVLGLQSEISAGDLPFFSRPALGGDNDLRGYPGGRFRDDASWLAAGEYRFWVLSRGFPIWGPIRVERAGLAAFYEIGSVAEDPAAFFQARVRQSYGFGLRATIERAAPFRIDFGFAPGGQMNVIARFGLAM